MTLWSPDVQSEHWNQSQAGYTVDNDVTLTAPGWIFDSRDIDPDPVGRLTSGVSFVFQNRSSRPAACAAVTYDRANAACSSVGLLDVGLNCVMSMSRQHHRCAASTHAADAQRGCMAVGTLSPHTEEAAAAMWCPHDAAACWRRSSCPRCGHHSETKHCRASCQVLQTGARSGCHGLHRFDNCGAGRRR